MGLCCCCGGDDDQPQKYQNESVIVVNDEGAITNQPTNKSNNSSFRFNPSQSNGFVNDAVEFDEIDLNERQVSVRSKDRSNHNSIKSKPNNNNSQTKPSDETINVIGLMVDQLYEEEDKCKENEEKVKKADECDDHLSREIVEEYDFDHNVITEATEDEVQRASTKSPDESLHRLTINLADETFGSTGALTSEPAVSEPDISEPVVSELIVTDPTPAPRTKSSLTIPPEPTSTSPPQWSPLENCHDEEVHETIKSPFELGVNDLEITPRESMPTTSAPSEPSDHDENENKPPYPAHDDSKMIHDQIKQNRMYGGFSSSSSSSSDSDNDDDEFELESTDRQHELKSENYSVLLNEETDKSNAG